MAPDRWRLEALPPASRFFWPLLDQIPPGFVLYGDAAIALRFGHRKATEFDFYSSVFPYGRLFHRVMKLSVFRSYRIGLRERYDVHKVDMTLRTPTEIAAGQEGIVKLSLASDPELVPGRLQDPSAVGDGAVLVASPEDLFAALITTSNPRTAERDLADAFEFIKRGYRLADAFALAMAFAEKVGTPRPEALAKITGQIGGLIEKGASGGEAQNIVASETLKDALRQIDQGRILNSKLSIQGPLSEADVWEPDGDPVRPMPPKKKYRSYGQFVGQHVWNDDRELLKGEDAFLVFLLARFPISYYEAVETHGKTDADFIRALGQAPPGLFLYEEGWRLAHDWFGLETPRRPQKYIGW
jgi:hypothetical protein